MKKTLLVLGLMTTLMFAEGEESIQSIPVETNDKPVVVVEENITKPTPSCLKFIQPLTDMPKFIQCNDSKLEDISYLNGIKEAKAVYMSINKISDLSPFKDLKTVSYQLYLGDNNISSLSPLSNLESALSLDISKNKDIEDLSPLNKLTINNTGFLYIDDKEFKVKLNHYSPICSSIRDNKIVFTGNYKFICDSAEFKKE